MATKTADPVGMKTADLLKNFKKEHGDAIGDMGFAYPDIDRISTGFFALDLALGGGLPRSRISELYGKESSGKTTICLKAIANHQRRWPTLTCTLIDMEGTYDKAWAVKLGVQADKLLVLRPAFAEEVTDMTEALLKAEDCGMVVIDSLASMITLRENDQSAEKSDVGGEAQSIKKLVRKAVAAIRDAEKHGRAPTLVCINQIRTKIGVMFGDPETTPGGHAPKFFASLRLRFYGKEVNDPKVAKDRPARLTVTAGIKKKKFRYVSLACEFSMATVNQGSFKAGDALDEWKLMRLYLQDYGLMEKDAKGKYTVLGKVFDTQDAIYAAVRDPKSSYGDELKKVIIERAKDEAEQIDLDEDDVSDE